MKETDPKREAILAAFYQRPGIMNDLVAAVHKIQPLVPFPACASCPASFWYLDSELACFCKVKKNDTWGGRVSGIVACAERETLLTPPESGSGDGGYTPASTSKTR